MPPEQGTPPQSHDLIPRDVDGLDLKHHRNAVTAGFASFAKWLSANRTPADLRAAREQVTAWDAVIKEFNANIRERLYRLLIDYGQKFGENSRTLVLKTDQGEVRLERPQSRDFDPKRVRDLCKSKGIDYEHDAAYTSVEYLPDRLKLNQLVSQNRLTQVELDNCRPMLAEKVVLS